MKPETRQRDLLEMLPELVLLLGSLLVLTLELEEQRVTQLEIPLEEQLENQMESWLVAPLENRLAARLRLQMAPLKKLG